MKERCPHSAFTSTSSSSKFLAISWPSAGASKTPPPPRRKTPGGRGEPEGRAVPHTHTHLLFFSPTYSHLSLSLFLSFTHTLSHTHFLPPLVVSHPIFSFLLFYFHTHTHTLTCHPSRRGETPWCPRVRRRLHIPGSLAVGLRGSRPRKPKVPSFISSYFREDEREIPREKKGIKIKGN